MSNALIVSLKRSAKRILRPYFQPNPASVIYFLHIGKNAGSNIGATIDAIKKSSNNV